ncbi:hypothetical protein AMK20_27315 [Streptomyces sp. TSRI0261]|nr:hypothetical protein AMK20_27315 [Streptomyces sp. TSRI0261]
MGTSGASEVDAPVSAVRGWKHRDGVVEAGRGPLVVTERSEGAGSGCVDVRGIEPGTPDAVGVRTGEKGQSGVVCLMGFTNFPEHGMGVSLVQNGDDLQSAPGQGGASGSGGEPESVGGMSCVNGELGLSAENVGREVGVAGDMRSVQCFRGVTVRSTFVADVLGEPACQFFVAGLQREEFDGVGTTGSLTPCGKGEEILLQGGQHVPWTDEVVGLNYYSAELCEVLERRAHVGQIALGRRLRGRNGSRSQSGEPGGENDTARHGHEMDPSVDSCGDDDQVHVVFE